MLGLKLENFRCHQDTEVELVPGAVQIFVGACGKGKTSLLAGIEYVVTNRCQWTDERGSHAGRLNYVDPHDPGGAYKSVSKVTLKLEEDFAPVSATRTGEGKLGLSSAPNAAPKDAQADLDKIVGCAPDRARVCLRGSRFFGLHKDERKQMISDLLDIQITDKMVEGALVLKQIENETLPILDMAREFAGKGGLANLSFLHQKAYDERTILNRAVKDGQASITQREGELQRMSPVSLVKLGQLRDEDKKLTDERIEVKRQLSVRRELETLLAKERKALQNAEKQLADLNESEGLPAPYEGPSSEALLSQKAKALEKVASLRSKRQKIDELTSEKAQFERLLDGQRNCLAGRLKKMEFLQASGPDEAPRCSNFPDLFCPCRPADLAQSHSAQVADVSEQISIFEAKIVEFETFISEINDQIDLLDVEGTATRLLDMLAEVKKIDAGFPVIFEAERAAKLQSNQPEAISRLQGEIETRKTQVAAFSERVDTMPDAPTETQIKLSEDASLAKRREVSAGETYLALEKRISEQKQELLKKLGQQEASEILVAFFSPTGFQAETVAAALKPFVSQVNRVLANFGQSVEYDSTLNLVRPYEQLSTGEQVMVAYAHQIAFARISGLRVVFVDQADALDDASQEALLESASDEIAELDHIILVGVRFVDSPLAIQRELT